MVHRRQSGLSLIEVMVSLVIASLLLVGLQRVLDSGLITSDYVSDQTTLTRSARFAMNRMIESVGVSKTLLIPLGDDPGTTEIENVREEVVSSTPPGHGHVEEAVLAVTIDPNQDMDLNARADADNDGDGRIDEDLPADIHNDGRPGVRDFDDDGNGIKDYFFSPDDDDDESNDYSRDEDPINGIDDDGDGTVDEDPGSDMNGDGQPGVAGVDDDGDGQVDEGDVADDDEDGLTNEDWYDAVIFYLDHTNLIERRSVPWDTNNDSAVNGRDYVESIIAENVSYLRFERVSAGASQQQIVDIVLTLASDAGESLTVSATVRLAGRF